jgi:hypothetical protein
MEPIDTILFGTIHRPKKINSKVKGNRNELTLTKLLTDWTGSEFVRVPLSGGLRWSNRVNICGDVISVDPTFAFPFSVETKHVKNLGINLLNNTRALRTNSVIFTYFSQCERDAKAANKIPMLIVRENGMKAGSYYVCLSLQFEHVLKMSNYIQPVFTGGLLCGFDSEEFFRDVKLNTLIWIYGNKD